MRVHIVTKNWPMLLLILFACLAAATLTYTSMKMVDRQLSTSTVTAQEEQFDEKTYLALEQTRLQQHARSESIVPQ